jgi:hypothetical protein
MPRQPDVLAHREVGQESPGPEYMADMALAQIGEGVLAARLPGRGDICRTHPAREEGEAPGLVRPQGFDALCDGLTALTIIDRASPSPLSGLPYRTLL